MLTGGNRLQIFYLILTCCSLLLLSSAVGQAQFLRLKFDHITSENGLPHSTIHGIAKDKYGFMWFGSWSGLCRYDGYRIRVYRYEPSNPKSIVNNRIHNVLKDSKGDIWVSTFDENFVCRYNYETDDFDRIASKAIPGEIAGKINRRDHRLHVSYTYNNSRWFLDNDKTTLVEEHLLTGKQKVYTVDSENPWSINDAYVSDLFLDDEHVLWLGTYSNGINRSYLDATPFHYMYHHPERNNSLLENTIRAISEDKKGNLWVGTRSKGISVLAQDGTYRHFQHDASNLQSIKSNYIKRIFCDSEGLVWIGTQKGLDRYDPKIDRIERINIPSLNNIAVFSFVEDRLGDVWLGTWNGIFRYDRARGTMVHFPVQGLLPHEHVWYLYEDSKEQLWAGTEGGGIAILKKDAEGIKLLKQLQQGTGTSSLSDSRIYSIFEDSDHRVWIGTGNGLDYYDPETGYIKHLSQQTDLWPKGTIAGITEDDQGFVWLSHKQGISRVDRKTFAIRTFSKQDGLQSNEFAEGAIHKSTFANRLYFGGNKGVSYFSPDSIRTNNNPPKVLLTELRILNQPVEVNQQVNDRVVLTKPLYLKSSLDLRHEDKSISLEFAALHYANPAGNKYAYMLEGFDKDWIYTDASKRVATYSNLSAGDYIFKVKASNSDGIWMESPTTLAIAVAPPIWASTAAYVVYTLVFMLLLYLFYYAIRRYTKLKSKLAYEAILHEKERELHESKVQFFTNISHEIKTPLSLILSPIQQLKGWGKENAQVQDQLQTMENNGNRLLKTVHQLLDIRRFETGHERLHLELADVTQLVEHVVNSFAQEAKQKKVRLKLSCKGDIPLLSIDADKLEKVCYNLLSNALKFTPAGGMIKVRVRQIDQQLVIAFIDNGAGISAEDMDRIFKPFLQGKSAVAGGSGLGLTYSKSLVEMHGGRLTVESRPQTERYKLTVFRLFLPLGDDVLAIDRVGQEQTDAPHFSVDQTAAQTVGGDATRTVLPRRCTLLLVEDNEEMRRYLANFFRQDYHILEAANGQDGLLMARKQMPDLIISDVMMPKVDGISFTRQVKGDILMCHIPIILLTARTLVEFEIEGLETGADDYMVKPFHLPVLALKVRNQLLALFRMQDKFKQQIALEPTPIDMPSPDEALLQKILAYVEENLSDSNLKIDSVCQSIGVSRAQLYRKMKALTGYSMADLIKEVRLKRAQQLLREKKFNVSEVAYMVGFSDPEYFRKNFKAKFGFPPSEYARR